MVVGSKACGTAAMRVEAYGSVQNPPSTLVIPQLLQEHYFKLFALIDCNKMYTCY